MINRMCISIGLLQRTIYHGIIMEDHGPAKKARQTSTDYLWNEEYSDAQIWRCLHKSMQ